MSISSQEISTFLAAHPAAIVAELTAVRGSSPREAGTFMLISEDAQVGTIGGGALEYMVIDRARQVLRVRQVRSSSHPAAWRRLQCPAPSPEPRAWPVRQELPRALAPRLRLGDVDDGHCVAVVAVVEGFVRTRRRGTTTTRSTVLMPLPKLRKIGKTRRR